MDQCVCVCMEDRLTVLGNGKHSQPLWALGVGGVVNNFLAAERFSPSGPGVTHPQQRAGNTALMVRTESSLEMEGCICDASRRKLKHWRSQDPVSKSENQCVIVVACVGGSWHSLTRSYFNWMCKSAKVEIENSVFKISFTQISYWILPLKSPTVIFIVSLPTNPINWLKCIFD